MRRAPSKMTMRDWIRWMFICSWVTPPVPPTGTMTRFFGCVWSPGNNTTQRNGHARTAPCNGLAATNIRSSGESQNLDRYCWYSASFASSCETCTCTKAHLVRRVSLHILLSLLPKHAIRCLLHSVFCASHLHLAYALRFKIPRNPQKRAVCPLIFGGVRLMVNGP